MNAYLKPRLDYCDRQHAHPSHHTGSAPQQHGLQRPWASLQKQVLLEGEVGAEVDTYARDGAHKRLEGRGNGHV